MLTTTSSLLESSQKLTDKFGICPLTFKDWRLFNKDMFLRLSIQTRGTIDLGRDIQLDRNQNEMQ